MVNRRLLRIKALQTLYAYLQSEYANYELTLDFIRDQFSPFRANTEEELELFKKNEYESVHLFSENYLKESPVIPTSIVEVRQAVLAGIDFYKKRNQEDFDFFCKNSISSIEKITDIYTKILFLLYEFRFLTKEKKITQNVFLKKLEEHPSFKSLQSKPVNNWTKDKDVIKNWYITILRKDDHYLELASKQESPTFEDAKSTIKYLVDKVILKNNRLLDYWENMDLGWKENKHVVKTLFSKLFKNVKEESSNFELIIPFSENWEEDKDFLLNLLRGSVLNHREYEEWIDKRLKNWDIERLSMIDRLLLVLAINEMIVFPNIPIKVTLNEYIELSKTYGTPKSQSFINGLLDTLSADLIAKGKIKKSGKGLLDNK